MNKIINKFLLTGDRFMPELHLKQPVFTYSACRAFAKPKQKIRESMQSGNLRRLYKNELDKACFAHNPAYSDSKDLTKRTKSDKILKDKAFEIANNPKYDGYQRGLASMIYKFFDIKSNGGCIKNDIKENQQLANELHKPITRKSKRCKVCSSFKGDIWGVDLADMQLISKCNKGIRYVLCVIDIFSKYACKKTKKV